MGETDDNNEEKPFVRDAKGLFRKGTRGGPGNPDHKKTHEFRRQWRAAISEDDIHNVILKLKDAALAGERWAIEHVLDREFGKPKQIIEQETVTVISPDEARATVRKFFGGAD